MVNIRQGDIFWAETENKRRPVLVITRAGAIPVLDWVVVAPVTRTVRHIPSELPLDERHGLREPCAASFDNLNLVPKPQLTRKIGALPNPYFEICRALGALADC